MVGHKVDLAHPAFISSNRAREHVACGVHLVANCVGDFLVRRHKKPLVIAALDDGDDRFHDVHHTSSGGSMRAMKSQVRTQYQPSLMSSFAIAIARATP